jgi:hypothetical protein
MNEQTTDSEAIPKGTPTSDRHEAETALHDHKDLHQTNAAKTADKDDLAQKKPAGPESPSKGR